MFCFGPLPRWIPAEHLVDHYRDDRKAGIPPDCRKTTERLGFKVESKATDIALLGLDSLAPFLDTLAVSE